MTEVPQWLKARLQCPQTQVPLVQETRDGHDVFVAYPEGSEPLVYRIDNGVPNLVPSR